MSWPNIFRKINLFSKRQVNPEPIMNLPDGPVKQDRRVLFTLAFALVIV